ncbi:Ribose import permease protein RbsC [Paraburkholderia sediminicola]|uniref:Ribose import permease protein RbsC n=1 Tax=Paraburkholderia sediminicola TaxID=458836 RepID=A0A6J5CVU2_9BURK|nr:ABC transporter permease [Paraburkholderia sediminicola]CAB3743808.1 Ribose import permease protein RbsC [Paraburkholderia sediminicola]
MAKLAPTLNARSPAKWFHSLRSSGAAIALVALLVFNVIFTREFLTLQTLNVNLTQIAPIMIVAVGMALVVATGGIDLSVGSTAAFAGTLAAVLLSQNSGPLANPTIALLCALVLPIVAAALLGSINGMLIARLRVQPIVATLILFIAGRGFAEMLTDSNLRSFTNSSFSHLGGNFLGVPVQGVLMVVVVAVVAWVMRKTVYARWVLATGGNERAAVLAGIQAHRVKLAMYVICGGLAGIAGLLNVAINSAADPAKIGLGIELDAIAAVAVGGTPLMGGSARIVGTMIGALAIQLLQYTLLAHGIQDEWALIVKAAIVLAAVYLQRR